VAKPPGDIPPGGFVAGNGTPPFRHAIGQAAIENKHSIQG
jgi:hypothetical protein